MKSIQKKLIKLNTNSGHLINGKIKTLTEIAIRTIATRTDIQWLAAEAVVEVLEVVAIDQITVRFIFFEELLIDDNCLSFLVKFIRTHHLNVIRTVQDTKSIRSA